MPRSPSRLVGVVELEVEDEAQCFVIAALAALARRARRESDDALERARAAAGHLVKIELEVDSLAQLEEALPLKPDVIMLDNFSLPDLRRAVEMTAGAVVLEASGGVTFDTVRAIAETGVDVISVGALTHSAPALDIGLDAE